MTQTDHPCLIAFYLPQYHPIPENDEWWGKGFTEWTNVVKAKPLFKGHYQPHLPADLGFYDLRVPEVRQAQADLAREYGISGFCYYHYWFNGKQLLERPFHEVLESGKPDFPFCLCWANENWTRTWDGKEERVLIKQQYSFEDDLNHINHLIPAFNDHRYIRFDGKPLFLVYRVGEMPDPLKTTEIWREQARIMGVGELFLCKVESNHLELTDPVRQGFDAAVEFQPDWTLIQKQHKSLYLFRLIKKMGLNPIRANHKVMKYESLITKSVNKPTPPYLRFPCVTPMWDNSARKKEKGTLLIESSPELYHSWLKSILLKHHNIPAGKYVFINAWNEWGEGNHLEPDFQYGKEYLEATKKAINKVKNT